MANCRQCGKELPGTWCTDICLDCSRANLQKTFSEYPELKQDFEKIIEEMKKLENIKKMVNDTVKVIQYIQSTPKKRNKYMKIKYAKLKTAGVFTDIKEGTIDVSLWKKIEAFMDEETAIVIESSMNNGQYLFLGLKDKEKDKELHYMIEQDSMIGVYIDDRERFNEDWDNDKYEPDGCIYLNPENVELLESEE